MPADEQLQQLRGHLRQKAILTTLHEGYPGHHLQFTHANRIPSKIRRLFGDNAFVEGWALYCEEMMCDLGYSDDPRVRLCQLRDALWRAVRVIVDTGLHCRGMQPAEAIAQLVDVAGLEPVNAETEVRRYTLTPTQPMTYTVGKLELQRLRADVEKQRGAAFNLREFHNQLLSYGSIPVPLIRRQMLPETAARA